MIHEGVNASYCGLERRGRLRGDRASVLTVDGATAHIQWITGARAGETDIVPSGDLVADHRRGGWGVEGVRSVVAVNASEVMSRTGAAGLLNALETEGHLDTLREASVEAVHLISDSLASDPAWREVISSLGENAHEFRQEAILAAIGVAVGEMNLGSTDDEHSLFQ